MMTAMIKKFAVEVGTVLGFLLLVLIIIGCIPLLVLWALNTLFSLNIPYTVHTWCAAVIILGLIPASKASK